MKSRRKVWAVLLAAAAAGCGGMRLAGPKPLPQDVVALRVADNATPDQVAALIKLHGVEAAILSSSHDSAWYASAATAAALKVTRTGKAGATTFAFLGPQALGDTTLTLKVPGGGQLRLHDALYRIDKDRRLDLMAIHMDSTVSLPASIKTLLGYIATDVLANAAVVFAIEPPTPALGDSVSVLIRAAFSDAWECTKQGRNGIRPQPLPLRMFYGPNMHINCENAERIDTAGVGLLGHFVLTQ